MIIPTIAIIPTRDRHAMLDECYASIKDQVSHTIIIDNLSDPPFSSYLEHDNVNVIRIDLDPPNISQLWNIGIKCAKEIADHLLAWNVAIFNSDVIVPEGWVDRIAQTMRQTTAVLAYSDQCGGNQMVLHTEAKPIDLRQRITGYAYMLRGESNLKLDETMKWWYSDDDLDWRARLMGGSLLVPGIPVEHRAPNGSTNARIELQEQASRDRETFIKKWGKAPH
jgi:hypothetical protein